MKENIKCIRNHGINVNDKFCMENELLPNGVHEGMCTHVCTFREYIQVAVYRLTVLTDCYF